MKRARQTFERRQLGLTLRRLRNAAGHTQQEVADAVGTHRSRVGELEEGIGTLSQDELGRMLDFYDIAGPERDTVLALGVEARKRQRGRVHTDLLPDSFQRFADLEANALEISSYEASILPGLLQSPGYARAVIENGEGIWWTPSLSEREERISFRIQRRVRLLEAGQSKILRFVLTEEAVRSRVGNPEVRKEQLRHILELQDHPGLTVQVLPLETYSNPARGGGFTLFDFGAQNTPIGFAASVFGPATYFKEEADIAALRRAFDKVRELALSPERSRQLVGKIAKED